MQKGGRAVARAFFRDRAQVLAVGLMSGVGGLNALVYLMAGDWGAAGLWAMGAALLGLIAYRYRQDPLVVVDQTGISLRPHVLGELRLYRWAEMRAVLRDGSNTLVLVTESGRVPVPMAGLTRPDRERLGALVAGLWEEQNRTPSPL